jgi:hypothetical protein
MTVLLILDFLFDRQILQIVFQVIQLERFAERELFRVSNA